MQQTVDADADVKEVAADVIIPVCGLSFYYFSVVVAATAQACSVTAATTAVDATITIPVAASGLFC